MHGFCTHGLRIFALAGALLVAACAPGPFLAASGASLMGSDKTIVDHAVSYGSGKDCSILRTERGLTYCVEDMPVVRQNIYCYRDLGGVTCYEKPSPNHTTQQRVDRNDHNYVK